MLPWGFREEPSMTWCRPLIKAASSTKAAALTTAVASVVASVAVVASAAAVGGMDAKPVGGAAMHYACQALQR